MGVVDAASRAGSRALQRVFVSAAPGLERSLERELQTLRVPGQLEVQQGGVLVTGTAESLWRTVTQSRVAEAVRVRVGDPFHAPDERTLKQRLAAMPWEDCVRLDDKNFVPPVVKASSVRSRLYHTKLVESRVALAVEARRVGLSSAGAVDGSTEPDNVGASPKGQEEGKEQQSEATQPAGATAPDIRVNLRHDECQVSVAASGPLHMRGYRKAVGDAPLRETLAAACVLASPLSRRLTVAAHNDEELVVWDPFCGSGVLLLEALAIVLGQLPHARSKRHPFTAFPGHDEQAYAEFCDSLQTSPHPAVPRLRLIGSDASGEQVDRARRNLRRFLRRTDESRAEGEAADLAGTKSETRFADGNAEIEGRLANLPCEVHIEQGAPARVVQNLAGKPVMILTNVPWGILSGAKQNARSGRSEAFEAYSHLGRMLRQHRADWRGVYCIAENADDFGLHTGAEWTSELRFLHGGRWVDLLQWTGKLNSGVGPVKR